MSVEAKLAALERAYETAQKNHLTIAATKEAGAVKRELRDFLLASPVLRDLFPSRLFASDAHTPTTALRAALARARERLVASAATAARDASQAAALLEEARGLARAKADKAAAKARALALLETSYPTVFTEHISFLRRQFRTGHTPSADIVTALRAAQRASASAQVDDLLATLDSLATRAALKARINAFLASAAGGRADLRPRRTVRVDHAPTESLIRALEELEEAYRSAADPARRDEALRTIASLDDRLGRRHDLKEERDRCLAEARVLRGAIAADKARARALLDAVADGLAAFEDAAARARARLREAETTRFQKALDYEAAERARDAVLARMDTLVDEPALPDAAGLDARRELLVRERTRLRDAIVSARTAFLDARRAHEDALASALSLGPRAPLPPGDELRRAEDALLVVERDLARVDVEADLLSSVDGELSDASVLRARSMLEGRLAGELQEQTRALVAARVALDAADRELQRLDDALGASEARAQEAVRVHAFCVLEHERVAEAMERCEELRETWERTDTLVHYVRFGEDVHEKLKAVADLVTGYRKAEDALGRVRVAFLVDVGVRAGVELGFVDLSAEVRLTLLVAGTLSVVDSREVVFESHLALFLSASAKARIGLGEPARAAAEALGVGDVLTVPDVLVEASAKCKLTLHDARACAVYDGKEHWAARWTHEIARRVAFVRSVELTRKGFEGIDEAWLDAEVARLASAADAHPWLRTLHESGARPGRDVTVAIDDLFEGSAVASLGSASVSARAGDVGDATLVVTDDKGAKVRVFESSLEFSPKTVKRSKRDERAPGPRASDPKAPSSFRGTVVHHTLEVPSARPRGRTEPRAYLEITMLDAHALTVGPLRLTSAATTSAAHRAVPKDAFLLHRALATSLDVEAHDHFEREVALPASLTKDLPRGPRGALEPAKALARTMRLRLDLVVARGDPRALTVLLGKAKSLEKEVASKLEAADTKAGEAHALAERLDAALREHTEEAARVVPSLRAVASGGRHAARLVTEGADAAREHASMLHDELEARVKDLSECLTVLDNSHAVHARYVRSWRCAADAGATRLAWSPQWVAQVHRGIARRTFVLEGEVGVDVVPLVRVFVGARLEVEAESAEFEAVAPSTTTYLKGLLGAMAATRWDAYWELHKGEILDLCEAIATPGSVPFSEVVLDALEGRPEIAPLARAIGDACFRLFRDAASPFAPGVFSEDAVIACLLGRLASAPAAAANVPLTKLQVLPVARAKPLPAEAFVTLRNLVRVRAWLVEPFLVVAERESGRSVERLLRSALAGFTRAEHLKKGIVKRYEGAGFERGTLEEERGRSALGDVRRTLVDGETSAATEASAVVLSSARLSDRLTGARALEARLEERTERHEAMSETLVELLGLKLPPPPATDDASPAILALRVGIRVAAAVLEGPREIPDPARWRSGSAVTFLMRSGATARLDAAVTAFDARGLAAPTSGRKKPVALDAAYAVAFEHVSALVEHLDEAVKLGEAVDAWFGDKDEGASKRGPSVAAVLELPLRRAQRRLAMALAVLLLAVDAARCLEEMAQLQAGIAAAEERMATDTQRIFRHRQDERSAERLTAATVKLQRAFRARRAKHDPARLSELRKHLEAYLRAASADFRLDALVHGRKKTLLRGESFPLHEVPEVRDDAEES